jgi:ATP-dependent RNA helicase RhlE
MVFEDFKFNPHIMAGVRALGYSVPTPIQEQAIPPIMQGRDLIGLAQTGTGKTAAFVLPILQRLSPEPRGRIRALVISPTRELADQTNEAVNDLGRETGLRSIAIYGGVGMDPQNRKLRDGVEIVVACPGRLLDHLWKGTVDLGKLEILVIDEADRMFDMGFLPDIKNILRCILQPRQTLLFSATMPPDIRRLVQEVLTDPVTVQIGQTAPAKTVSHALYPVPQHLKATLLMEVLRRTETESVLVFTRTKHRTERIARQLQKAGLKAVSLQGDLAQNQRRAAIDGFRDGYYKILVATDIAARGIDVLSISHVINFDMPESIDAYIHRIGRTGRVDKSGSALTFVTSADAPLVKELERVLKAPVERCTIPGFNYNAPEMVRVTASQPRQRTTRRTFRTQAAPV